VIACFDRDRQGIETARLRFAVEQPGPRDKQVHSILYRRTA
jgi:hypothetical protein